MAELVSPDEIEQIVGVKRHRQVHYGRAASTEQTFYILHSQRCLDSGVDLRECRFSVALDRAVQCQACQAAWDDLMDRPVGLAVWQDHLIPLFLIRSMERHHD